MNTPLTRYAILQVLAELLSGLGAGPLVQAAGERMCNRREASGEHFCRIRSAVLPESRDMAHIATSTVSASLSLWCMLGHEAVEFADCACTCQCGMWKSYLVFVAAACTGFFLSSGLATTTITTLTAATHTDGRALVAAMHEATLRAAGIV